MNPISINMMRDIVFGVDNEVSECDKCLFHDRINCTGCDCAVGNVLKSLVDGGFLSIDDSAEKEVEE